jgi:hypothetical protein
MGRQTFDRIKKTTCIILAVLFVVSLTASAGAACPAKTSNTGLSTGNTGLGTSTSVPGLSNFNLGNLGSTYGINIGNPSSNSDFNMNDLSAFLS